MIKAIIFDCWNTLFSSEMKNIHPFEVFANKLGRSLNDYEYLKQFEKHFMLDKYQHIETPIKNLIDELNIERSDKLVRELKDILEIAFNKQDAFPEVLETLNLLKKNYKLGLISNAIYQSFDKLENKFKISKIFNVILASCEVKIIKPDPKIFEIMIKKLNINKNEVLMVGDSLIDDIEASEKFGIKGILVDRQNKYPNYANRITSLDQISRFI